MMGLAATTGSHEFAVNEVTFHEVAFHEFA